MTDLSLTKITIAKALEGLKKKEFSALELIDAHIKRSEEFDNLNAFITKTFDKARDQAKIADANISSGNVRAMEGIPIGMKDLFCTKGVKTTAASKILKNFVPTYESTVSSLLASNGAISLGKMNLDEFAMGSANITSAFGKVINPIKANESDEELVPGGSSGGSAAAVASGMVMAATGTDTGGSIRQPAAFCGIVGIKPTYGRCSRWGCIAFASSLDHPGPMARTVEDAAIMLSAMSGYDEKDATSVDLPVEDFTRDINNSIKGMKIGIPREFRIDGLSDDINKMWDNGIEWLRSEGAEIVDISLPNSQKSLATYYVIAPAEASSNLARYDGVRFTVRSENLGNSLDDMYKNTRGEGFGDEVKRRIMIGTYMLSAGYYDAYYLQAQKVRRMVADDFKRAFKEVDVILTPTTPNSAFSANNPPSDPVEMFMNDVLTVPMNLAGVPAISIPAAINCDGLPLGLQVIAPEFQESRMINVAKKIEDNAGFNLSDMIIA